MTKTVNKIPEALRGLVIKTKYLGATDHRQARVKATHLREDGVLYSKTTDKNFGQITLTAFEEFEFEDFFVPSTSSLCKKD